VAERVTLAWWPDTTLGADLGIADVSTGEIYAAMVLLAGRPARLDRKKLAAKHLGRQVNPSKIALFDLSSTWMTGNPIQPSQRRRPCRLHQRDPREGCESLCYSSSLRPRAFQISLWLR
jgi:hypothetical protein